MPIVGRIAYAHVLVPPRRHAGCQNTENDSEKST